MKEKLKKYLETQNLGNVSEIIELTDGNSSNHLNYKITTSKGIYVARVTKAGDLLSYTNLPDEYTVLKRIEKYTIAPQAILIDLEYFESPILIEEFIDGISCAHLQIMNEEIFEGIIKLLAQTSKITISADEFPFKFTYTTYQTNFKMWSIRLEEIAKSLGNKHFIISGLKSIIKLAQEILEKKDSLLLSSSREFIYNDVHPGNTFWLPKENKAKFIDWQKVSIGDPAFMIALFARRFGYLWKMENPEFSKKVLESYEKEKQINNLGKLLDARMLERSVSDMIWSIWADIKKNVPIKITDVNENKYYNEAKELMSGM